MVCHDEVSPGSHLQKGGGRITALLFLQDRLMAETFSPSVVIDGRTIHPPGWMYILAMALRGVPWAVDEALKPEFDQTVKEWLRNQRNARIQEEIDALLARVKELKEELHI